MSRMDTIMQLWGLTGSVGMGKSTVAKLFAACGVPVFDSDAAVHRLMAAGGAAVQPVLQRFPDVKIGSGKNATIDRKVLGKIVFSDTAAMAHLEAILHPLVRVEQEKFIQKHQRLRAPMVLLDIPLLYETGADERFDKVIVVTAPHAIQRQRVLARPGMTEKRFVQILDRQLPDSLKQRAADSIIHTGNGKAHSMRQVKRLLKLLYRK